MNFKKEKLKSISHSDKMWWIRAAPTSRAVILINKVLKKFDPQIKCGLDDYYFEECGLKFTPNYSSWKNRYLDFYVDNECGYIFFMENQIHII